MATRINEQRMIEDNVLLYENRLKSPIRRFIDKNFRPVRYWHIKSNETTVDPGYGDVAEILGKNSPIKFQYIENLPMYGLETLVLNLDTTDQGLDSSYEGEGTIMEGTIRPFPNDYFMVGYLKEPYIFRVTKVDYDTVASEQSYKISFILEYIDAEMEEQIKSQTSAEFTCILENIGTEESCIIEKADIEILNKIDDMYNEMVQSYLTIYYNKRYGCLLGELDNYKLYDPFQTMFINEHQLFHQKNDIDSIVLFDQFADNRRKIKYQKTIYRFFELKRLDHLSRFPFCVITGASKPETAFSRWIDLSVVILDIMPDLLPENYHYVMSEDFKEVLRLNGPIDSVYGELMRKYIREEVTIYDIPLTLCDDLLRLENADLELFFYTPILLYIIKETVNNHLKRQKNVMETERVISKITL